MLISGTLHTTNAGDGQMKGEEMDKDVKWLAGWNLPGCLPEMDPALFDSYEEAEAWIEQEQTDIRWGWAVDYEDPYVYWVEIAEAEEVA
jgi:hypothetical protein